MADAILTEAKDGTTYTLRLLPIGGYVRMAGNGDDETEMRSEERRVGKECRSRWSPYH